MFLPQDIPLQVPRQAAQGLRLPSPPSGPAGRLPSGFGRVPEDIPLRVEPDRFDLPATAPTLLDLNRGAQQPAPPAGRMPPGMKPATSVEVGLGPDLPNQIFVSDVDNSGWELSYELSSDGGGLVVRDATFLGIPVLRYGAQPFTLIVREGGIALKDGIGVSPVVGDPASGRPYQPLHFEAPNTGVEAQLDAPGLLLGPYDVAEVVHVDSEAPTPVGSPIHPACLVLAAKFQAGYRQYVQRWEFCADGRIEPSVSVGGLPQLGAGAGAAYLVNYYYRMEFSFAAGNQVVSKMVGVDSGVEDGPVPPRWFRLDAAEAVVALGAQHTQLRISDGPLAEGPVFTEDELSAADVVDPAYLQKLKLLAESGKELPLEHTHVPTVPSYGIVPDRYVPPDGFYSTADFFVMDAGPPEVVLPPPFPSLGFPSPMETLGGKVGEDDARDQRLMTWYKNVLAWSAHEGGSKLGTTILVWPVLRQYRLPLDAPAYSQVVAHRFTGLDIVPRGILVQTPPVTWAEASAARYLVAGLS